MKKGAFLVLVTWIICGTLSFGIIYGHFSTEFPPRYETHHYGISFMSALAGPIGLIPALAFTDFAHHGIAYESKYNPASTTAKEADHDHD